MKRILVIHRGSLGDFLLLLPSLTVLRRRFAAARIEILGRAEISSLACPGIADSTASVERAAYPEGFRGDQARSIPTNCTIYSGGVSFALSLRSTIESYEP